MANIIFAVLAVSFIWQGSSGAVVKPVTSRTDFDHLLLAQFWPPSSCIYFHDKGVNCSLPSYIKGWTIHGLWPSNLNEEQPAFCNSSMKFDYSLIKDLKSDLDLNWHYYNGSGYPSELWEHEWDKHGTCAFPISALKGEHNYFKRTLDIHKNLNTSKALSMSGIEPSESKTYNREDIFGAIKKYYSYTPNIVCEYERETSRTFVEQIYLCFDKDLNPQHCPTVSHESSFYENCEEQDKIYYLPMKPELWSHSNTLFFETENGN